MSATASRLGAGWRRYHSVKLYGITGYNARYAHDFQAAGIAWQYRWGGGF
jgi:hypothetical protein